MSVLENYYLSEALKQQNAKQTTTTNFFVSLIGNYSDVVKESYVNSGYDLFGTIGYGQVGNQADGALTYTIDEIAYIANERGEDFDDVFWEIKKEEGWTLPLENGIKYENLDTNKDGVIGQGDRRLYFGASRSGEESMQE